jgi:pimeloyl-ACP methyl ester carboxylesterase
MNRSLPQQATSVLPSPSSAPDMTEVLQLLTRPSRAEAGPVECGLLDRAERLEVRSKGRRLAAWTWGEGPNILLVHGWDSRASHLGSLVAALRWANCRVVAFDAPAHGDSEGTASDVMDIGHSILDVAGQLGPFDAVIAHSVGSPASLFAFAQGMRVSASIHLAGPSSLKRVLSRLGDACRLTDDQLSLLQKTMAERIGDSLDAMELENLSEGMRHPALLLHDPDDLEVPYSESVILQAAWPQSELRPVPGVGHRRIIREKPAIDASVHFITQHLSHLAVDRSGASSHAYE